MKKEGTNSRIADSACCCVVVADDVADAVTPPNICVDSCSSHFFLTPVTKLGLDCLAIDLALNSQGRCVFDNVLTST